MALIRSRRDPRVLGYASLAVVLIAVAMVRGHPGDLVAATPFVLALVVGLRSVRQIDVDARIEMDLITSFEGDEVAGSVIVLRPAGLDGLLTIDPAPGWSAIDPDELSWELPRAGAGLSMPFRIRADHWGRHQMGAIHLTFRRPYGLIVWEATNRAAPAFAVLPSPQSVRQLLPPPQARATAGAHISRVVGDGFDFAELRPYAAGDRLRDINWQASARSDQLQTNKRHPDRSGDVVILLDTFVDGVSEASATLQAALTRSARAAWAMAQLHLDVQDRVGLATQGRVVTQLLPRSGDRARYALLDALLSVGGLITAGKSAFARQPLSRLPPGALVLALTPLIDRRFAADVLGLHRSGRAVMLVLIELGDLMPPPVDQAEVLARRIYQMATDQLRDDITNGGVPLVSWRDDGDLSAVIGGLRRMHRRPSVLR